MAFGPGSAMSEQERFEETLLNALKKHLKVKVSVTRDVEVQIFFKGEEITSDYSHLSGVA